MPGPSIVNRAAQDRQAAAVERKTYFLTDPFCTEIHGVEVTDHIRENGLRLTSAEAMTLVAAGAVTTDRATASATVDQMKADHEALVKKREDAAAASKLASDEADDAAMHNLGQTGSTTSGAGAPPVPGDGSLSAKEVDALMSKTPAEAPPSPAADTWAASQSHGA